MALRDYIRCKKCDCKLIPDGNDIGRQYLEDKFDCKECADSGVWESILLCPNCIQELEEVVRAVAHIGVDFGYGNYELQPEVIDKARSILDS